MASKSSIIRDELLRLAKGRKALQPQAVVNAASDPTSPLHSCFVWDNTKAANEYRLWQARQLIVSVKISFDGPEERVFQAFVSLKPDRIAPGGGYRKMTDVMGDAALREELLKTALGELNAFRERYSRFKELAPIFDAARRVAARRKSKAA